jgi:hypothetical protein
MPVQQVSGYDEFQTNKKCTRVADRAFSEIKVSWRNRLILVGVAMSPCARTQSRTNGARTPTRSRRARARARARNPNRAQNLL